MAYSSVLDSTEGVPRDELLKLLGASASDGWLALACTALPIVQSDEDPVQKQWHTQSFRWGL